MSQNYYNGFKIGIVYKLSIHLFSHLFRMFRPNVTACGPNAGMGSSPSGVRK